MEIHLNNITKTFNTQTVLHSLNINLKNIHSLVVIGPSGGGKTTFLRLLAGLEKPSNGTIKVNQHEIHFNEYELRKYRSNIGIVFQDYNLFPHMTAIENITLPLIKVHGVGISQAKEQALMYLKRFQLEDHYHKKPMHLSGGQRQRVAISRAVAINPEILFLDEPTSALDPEFTAEVLDLIKELQEEGMDIIMVTHEMGFAQHVADHVLFMTSGHICESGTPETIFNNPHNSTVYQFLKKVLKY